MLVNRRESSPYATRTNSLSWRLYQDRAPQPKKKRLTKEKTREKLIVGLFHDSTFSRTNTQSRHALTMIIRSSDWFWAQPEFGDSFSFENVFERLFWGGAPLILFSFSIVDELCPHRIEQASESRNWPLIIGLPEPSLMLAFAIINYEMFGGLLSMSSLKQQPKQSKKFPSMFRKGRRCLWAFFYSRRNVFPASEC